MTINPDTIAFYQRAFLAIFTPHGSIQARHYRHSFELYRLHKALGWAGGLFLPMREESAIGYTQHQPWLLAELQDTQQSEPPIQGFYIARRSWREAISVIRTTGLELALFGENTKIDGGTSILRLLVSDTKNIPMIKPILARSADKLTHKWRQEGIRVRKRKYPKNAPRPD